MFRRSKNPSLSPLFLVTALTPPASYLLFLVVAASTILNSSSLSSFFGSGNPGFTCAKFKPHALVGDEASSAQDYYDNLASLRALTILLTITSESTPTPLIYSKFLPMFLKGLDIL